MKESLILVDEHDVAIGTAEKIDTHRKGLLHRAFSLFIYCADKKMFLLQKGVKKSITLAGSGVILVVLTLINRKLGLNHYNELYVMS